MQEQLLMQTGALEAANCYYATQIFLPPLIVYIAIVTTKDPKHYLLWQLDILNRYAALCYSYYNELRVSYRCFGHLYVAVPCRNRKLFFQVFRSHHCLRSAVSLNFR